MDKIGSALYLQESDGERRSGDTEVKALDFKVHLNCTINAKISILALALRQGDWPEYGTHKEVREKKGVVQWGTEVYPL